MTDLVPDPLPTEDERAKAKAAEALALMERPPTVLSDGQLSLVDEP